MSESNNEEIIGEIKIQVNSFNDMNRTNTCIASTAELVKRRFRGLCLINKCEIEFALDKADGKRVKVLKAKVEIKLGNQSNVTEVMILPSLPVDCLFASRIG